MTEPDRDREHLIAFWRRLQKAAFEMASRNVAITLRDAAWLYAKGYDIDAPIETMINFIVYVDRLELGGGAAVTPPEKTEKSTGQAIGNHPMALAPAALLWAGALFSALCPTAVFSSGGGV
jgi:hypothetical protein